LSLICFLAKSKVAGSPINYVVYTLFLICFAFMMAFWEAAEDSFLDDGFVFAYTCMACCVVGALFIHNLVAK